MNIPDSSAEPASNPPASNPPGIAAATPPTLPLAPSRAGAANALECQPLGSSERLQQVDFLRGVALLGILVVNMGFFFEPFGRMMNFSWLEWVPTADRAAWAIVNAFFAFKFISLFSMMFGFGVAMQMHRVDESGRSAWAFGVRRFGVLALFGLVHGVLVWYGDILFVYAWLGMVLVALRRVPANVLLIIAACIGGVLVLFAAGGAAMQALAQASGTAFGPPDGFDAQGELPTYAVQHAGFAGMKAGGFFPGSQEWMAAEAVAYRDGPFLDALAYRAVSWSMAVGFAVFSYGWHALFMMLLGTWAFKSGFWRAEHAALRRRIAWIALGVGLPVTVASVAMVWATNFQSQAMWGGFQFLHTLSALILPAGYAVVIGSAAMVLPGVIVRPIASAGRMALSVYLLESLVATACSYWWGLALFGSLDGMQCMRLAVCIWLGLVAFSTAWLSVFRMGPMEWVWRACTYLTLHPARATSRSGQRAA